METAVPKPRYRPSFGHVQYSIRPLGERNDKMRAKQVSCGLALVLMGAFGAHPVSAGVNLVRDGGFEVGLVEPGGVELGLGAYGAWTSPTPGGCAGSTEILGLPLPNALGGNALPAYEGDEAMNLGPCFGDGSVSQAFTTTVGEQYEVSLAVIGGTVTITVFNAYRTDLAAAFVPREGKVWGTVSYVFTATHTDTVIMVKNTSPKTSVCCSPTIDDIRVVSTATAL